MALGSTKKLLGVKINMTPIKIRCRRLVAWMVSVMLLAGCAKESKNPLAPTDENPPAGLDAFTQNAKLGRGINFGNALEAPNEGEWGVTLKSEYFDLTKTAGFTSVRIPIRWSAHAATNAPYTIANSFLQRIDWAIDQALTRKLAVVINIHHYEEIMINPAAHPGEVSRDLAAACRAL